MRGIPFTVLLAIVAIACGNVSQTPSVDGGGGDGGGADAGGGPSLDLRLLHTARGELTTDLFAADVVDGELGPEVRLNRPGDSVRSSPLSASEDGSTVVFQTANGESNQLFVVDLGGAEPAEPVRVSTDSDSNFIIDQFLAADGRAVIYSRGSSLGIREQYFFVDLSADSPSDPIPLTSGDGALGGARLSADGDIFVFRNSGEAFVVDTSGSVPTAAVRISPTPPNGGRVQQLQLSADGSRAVLVGDLETNDVSELFVVDLSGAIPGPAQKASGPLVDGGDVSSGSGFFSSAFVSSDGGLVGYIADANTDGVKELFLVDTSGAAPGPAVRANDPPVAGGEVSVSTGGSVALSPDGARVAFVADIRVDGVMELFVGDLAGNSQRVSGPLADGGNVLSFAFAPDGSGIAYLADQNTEGIVELFYVDLSGALPSSPRRVNADLNDGGEVSPAPVFSPDGSQLAFRADAVLDGRFELFLAEIVDGAPQPPVSLQEPSVSESSIAQPTFSASGEWLAYAGNTAGPNRELWLIDLRGETPGAAVLVNSQVETATGVTNIVLRPGF